MKLRNILILLLLAMVLVVGGGIGLLETSADRRENEILKTMQTDPVWDLKPVSAELVSSELIEGCGPRSNVGYRESRLLYRTPIEKNQIKHFYTEELEELGWRKGQLPLWWVKEIRGRSFDISLGFNSTDGSFSLTMSSPGDMCQTNWFFG